jgi:hypothetical protein
VALQFSNDVRDGICLAAQANGSSYSTRLRVYSGSPPATTADAATGVQLAFCTLGIDCFDPPVSGTMSKSAGAWKDLSADATGAAGYFRLTEGSTTYCYMQGTVTAIGGGGDLQVNDVNFQAGALFQVVSCTITAPGA